MLPAWGTPAIERPCDLKNLRQLFRTHWKNYLCPSSPSQLPTPKKARQKTWEFIFCICVSISVKWRSTLKPKELKMKSYISNKGISCPKLWEHHPPPPTHPPTQLTKQLTNHNQLESLKFSFVQLGRGTSTQNIIMLVIRRVVAFEPNGSLTLGPPRGSFRELCPQKVPENTD